VIIDEGVAVVLGLRPEPAPVMANRGQVEQIVMNLALNARDAMPRGGTLTLETAHAELNEHHLTTHRSTKPGSCVSLAVPDTGTGMTPQVQARLFEPFFTTKELGPGTRLGLVTVRHRRAKRRERPRLRRSRQGHLAHGLFPEGGCRGRGGRPIGGGCPAAWRAGDGAPG
jgi:signal transduction histidine kinase